MSALDVAQRYFDGWNQHDAGFLVATFDPDGTYRDPETEGALSGQAIGAYASSLFTAFPDLSFELAAAPVADAESVTAQWIMRGFALGGQTGIYVSHRTDHEWTRCESCGVMLDRSEDLSTCRCGQAVAARPPMWCRTKE